MSKLGVILIAPMLFLVLAKAMDSNNTKRANISADNSNESRQFISFMHPFFPQFAP